VFAFDADEVFNDRAVRFSVLQACCYMQEVAVIFIGTFAIFPPILRTSQTDWVPLTPANVAKGRESDGRSRGHDARISDPLSAFHPSRTFKFAGKVGS
jgi:hypothetical protein